MKLIDVYEIDGVSDVLWDLLAERPAIANISHREMPTREEHEAFIASKPYEAWYLVEATDVCAGAINLTYNDEIGIALFKRHWGKGFAQAAIDELMRLHPRARYLANIAPTNEPSIRLFERLGFSPIQTTYEVRPDAL